MTAKTIKIIVLLLAVLTSLAAAAPNEPLHTAGPLTNSVFSQDPNFALGADRQFNAGGIYWRMMLAVLLVLALGVAAYYVSKKLGGKIINLPNRQIKLVETLYLGSRKTLHLIKVGNKSIVIGTTPTTITRIADISDSSVMDKPK
jgi:flagellar biosynthetic protein FliO